MDANQTEPLPAHEDISFLIDRSLTDSEVEDTAIRVIDEALHHPTRLLVNAGDIIIREGEPVDGIFLRLSGRVTLSRKIDQEDRVFHARTAGRVLGLMSLADGARAFFTCRAETDSELIHISYPKLDEGLRSSTEVSSHFATLLLRSLSRRNQRAIELQIDIDRLNKKLARERDQLSETLEQLEKAQMRLVESEKMATLGQLVAGIGHEMNNPVAAINRAASFMADDLRDLAEDHPDRELFLHFMDDALIAAPLSTREQRERTTALTAALKNAELARRLVKIGITQHEDLPASLRRLTPAQLEQRLPALERYYHLGASLRNTVTCSDRIARLVSGLRSYARTGKQIEPGVDLAREIDETLLIFGHALREITVEKIYAPIPTITCQPGELNQVWTNLISNAIQAMNSRGTLRIELENAPPNHVQVKIIDSGCGIAPKDLSRIFELNFTTRQGRVEFGLGLGLAICKDIVHRHGGTIAASSQPGRTEFSVRLPITPQNMSESELKDPTEQRT